MNESNEGNNNTFNQVEAVLRERQSQAAAVVVSNDGKAGGGESKGITTQSATTSMNSIVDSAINFAKFF